MSERLFREPYRFDFFQAVRCLRQLALELAAGKQAQQRFGVGDKVGPAQEVVGFRAARVEFSGRRIVSCGRPKDATARRRCW